MEAPDWADGLSTAAIKLRTLLRDVDSASAPLWTGEPLRAAIVRYTQIFLPMLAAHLRHKGAVELSGAADKRLDTLLRKTREKLTKLFIRARGDRLFAHLSDPASQAQYLAPFRALSASASTKGGGVPEAICPVPPLDVAFCWMLHRLSPADYEADCVALFGARLPAGGDTGTGLDYVGVHNADTPESATARLQWACFARAVRNVSWGYVLQHRNFLPLYLWPRFRDGEEVKSFEFRDRVPRVVKRLDIEYDLRAAARRQKQFLFNVSSKYYDREESIERGVRRYKKFLLLMRRHRDEFFVPLYDIDLVWHAHILRSTSAYERDCKKIVGRFVNHREDDDRSVGSMQNRGYERTKELWQQAYGEEYEDMWTRYQGKLGPKAVRVFPKERSSIIAADADFRAEFMEKLVCESCAPKNISEMEHQKRRLMMSLQLRLARNGQAHGGACAALFAKGFIGPGATMSDGKAGGACGGFAVDAGE